MFQSKRRPLVIPQSEHLRLVGILAMLWGNADFDLPPVERNSMIAGMGLHDRGYGLLDNHPIGGMDEEEWNEIAHRGFSMYNSDVVADTIVKYHIRRLASHYDSDKRKAMAFEFSLAIEEQLMRNHLSKGLFDRIDRITDLCDRISFAFCFDVPHAGEVPVFPRNHANTEVAVQYRVEAGTINATPWPFSVDRYEGFLTAYRADGYPGRPDPVILNFDLRK